MLEFLIAFILGVLSIVSPCVLPIVPLIFAGSRGKAVNAVMIVVGLISSAILAGTVVSLLPFKILAYVIILLFSILLISEKFEMYLTARFPIRMRNVSALPSFIFGFLLAFLWLPCIAPFAGIALAQSILAGPLVMAFYGMGMAAGIGLALKLGENLVKRVITKKFDVVRKVAGIVILIYLAYFALSEVLYWRW